MRLRVAEFDFSLGPVVHPVPFSADGRVSDNRLAVSYFGLVFALNTMLFLALQLYILRRLIKPEFAQDPHGVAKGLGGPASYLLGASLAWVSVYAAFAIYALTPLFYLTPPRSRAPSADREADA